MKVGKPYATVTIKNGIILGNRSSDVDYVGSTSSKLSNPNDIENQYRESVIHKSLLFDLQSNYKFIPYGLGDVHFEHLRRIQELSLLHSAIVTTASQFIAGEISFKFKDIEGDLSDAQKDRIKELKEFYRKADIYATHSERAYSLYAYGAAPTLLRRGVNANENLNTFKVAHRNAPTFRIGKLLNSFEGRYAREHYYSYNWNDVNKDQTLTNAKIMPWRKYFNTKNLKKNYVLKLKNYRIGISDFSGTRADLYSYVISLPTRTNKYYPKPSFESVEFAKVLDQAIALADLNSSTVERGLHSDYIITKYRSIYDSPDGDDEAEKQKNLDLYDIKTNYLGSKNAGTVKVNFMGIAYGNEKTMGEGSITVTPIPSTNNFAEIEKREASLSRAIRTAHKVSAPELLGIQDTKSGFSNIADYLVFAMDLYLQNVIVPHQQVILNLYNEINRQFGFEEIETIIKTRTGTTKALIQLFADALTVDEIRSDVFAKEPLTDAQRGNVPNTDSGGQKDKEDEQEDEGENAKSFKAISGQYKNFSKGQKNELAAMMTQYVDHVLAEKRNQ